ncbi:MAG: peptide-methionine (S)-S-oxide reductase MsrA [Candidatus Terrybacteria bacterium]|nr:peptide-methionine (S)-S-oxide reductase MsrA [Candidatus Terrybacteria bacterium]
MAGKSETAVFGGGCFWCVEAIFSRLRGVVATEVGFAGGGKERPTYEEVHVGATGHAEAVKVEYDPSTISYRDLLTVFFGTHDPTTLNRQENDVGQEYRSVIFFTTEAQRREAEKFIAGLEREGAYDQPIVTQVRPLTVFFRAEEGHQSYFEKNPERAYCQIVIAPKIDRLRQRFGELLASAE